MKLIKWFTEQNETLFGNKIPTFINLKNGTEFTEIIIIGSSNDRKISYGLFFGTKLPTGMVEIKPSNINPKEIFLSKTLKDDSQIKFLTETTFTDLIKFFRQFELDNLTVSIVKDGKSIKLDADEKSQERMNRTGSNLKDNETQIWKTTDKDFVTLTKSDFKLANRLASDAQTELWVKYSI